MTEEGSEEMVAFRLAPRDRASIQRLVAAGAFRNRSDFLRYAVKAAIEKHADALRGMPDLEIPDIQLPTQPPRARRAVGRAQNDTRR